MTQHRAGRLKQINKKHKTPGGTRPSAEGSISGRIGRKSAKTTNTSQLGKQDRLNRHKQLMQEKRLQSIRTKRQASSINTTYIAVLPLSGDIRFASFSRFLLNSNEDFSLKVDSEANSSNNRFTLYSKAQKTNFTFFTPGLSAYEFDPLAITEAVSACHSVLLLFDCADDMAHPLIDELGDKTIQLLMSYGFPGISVGYITSPANKFNFKNPPKVWKFELENATYRLSCFADLKYYDVKDHNLSRYLTDQSKIVKWRHQRSYLITEQLQIIEEPEEEEEVKGEASNHCKIIVHGVIGGAPLNVNSLVHIAGVGVGRIQKITKIQTKDHHRHHHSKNEPAEMEEDDINDDLNADTLEADPTKQDDLILEAEADILQGEQTWPEESEMVQNDSEFFDHEESEGEGGEEGGDLENEDDVMDFFNREQLPGSSKVQHNEQENNLNQIQDDGDEEEEHGDFVESPFVVSARSRFARYRALQSFRSSTWNPKENLPPQYSKIFEFEDIKGMQKRTTNYTEELLKKQFEPFLQIYQSSAASLRSRTSSLSNEEAAMDTGSIEGGHSITKQKTTKQLQSDLPLLLDGTEDFARSNQYVRIEIDHVPTQALQQQYEKDGYIVLYSLHPHEYKLSVLHFSIKRVPGNQEVIKSKDELLFYHGFRSYWTKPIFSESNLNCDKHKFQRYLPLEGFSVASCIGPVLLTPSCPLLIYKRSLTDNSLQLVATGSLLSIDPDRIMLKKIILTGNPIRVRKRIGVIKHMFYDPLDVRYFKPAELVTKHGLRGHIKESVGTHGLFKALFSGSIKQNDKVLLVLYKRVYPKIPEEGIQVK